MTLKKLSLKKKKFSFLNSLLKKKKCLQQLTELACQEEVVAEELSTDEVEAEELQEEVSAEEVSEEIEMEEKKYVSREEFDI